MKKVLSRISVIAGLEKTKPTAPTEQFIDAGTGHSVCFLQTAMLWIHKEKGLDLMYLTDQQHDDAWASCKALYIVCIYIYIYRYIYI